MNPHQKPRPLFFTPRSPWGRLPLKRTHQSHMRASEDAPTATGKKPDPTPKELQGLGGAMARNQLGGQPAQAGGAGNDVWKVPHIDPQNYQVPQQPQSQQPSEIVNTVAAPANFPSAGQMRQAGEAYRIVPQQEKGLFGGHFRGSFDYGRDRPKTERTDGSFEAGFYSNPGLQDQLEEEELRDRRIQPPETGEQPKPKLPAYDEKKEKEQQQPQWPQWQPPQGPGRPV